MNRLSPTILAASLFGAVFLIGLWLLVIPQFKEMGVTFGALDKMQQPTTVTKTKSATRSAQEQQILDLKTQAQTLLPSSDQQYDLSVQIEALSRSVGVSLTGLSLNASQSALPTTAPAQDDSISTKATPTPTAAAATPKPASAGKKVTATITVTGSYANIERFIIGLTSLGRYISIDQTSVTNAANGAVTAQVTAFGYYL
jgi:hypothetical protein